MKENTNKFEAFPFVGLPRAQIYAKRKEGVHAPIVCHRVSGFEEAWTPAESYC
ncbi:MAG: hypothetical protein J6T52_13095 [Bacteroidaceae bacterium]|nr:hypothetical protein [Bacteroidaceae bacterium]